ncbi:MAG: hypothetical protein CL912_31635 [Deltaproteobacteria bacterium]|nr:hypothetical protein [Deltaproteobacteria bacterium]
MGVTGRYELFQRSVYRQSEYFRARFGFSKPDGSEGITIASFIAQLQLLIGQACTVLCCTAGDAETEDPASRKGLGEVIRELRIVISFKIDNTCISHNVHQITMPNVLQ